MGTRDETGASRPSTAFSYLTVRTLHAYSAPPTIDSLEDWSQLRARILATPDESQIRGMFPAAILKLVPEVSAPRGRYLPFSNYPMTEYLDLILQAARLRYPGMTAGNAVLRLGAHVYATFAGSLAGMAIFGIAHLDLRRAIELSPRAYEVTLRPGRVEVLHAGPREARVQLRGVWAFPDIFHAGIWLGGMEACHASGSISITRHSLCDVDFDLRWDSTRT